MERKRLFGWLWVLIAFVGLSGVGWANPGLWISGRLLDANGNPIHYYAGTGESRYEIKVNLGAQIVFYDSETTQSSTSTLDTTAEANEGYFNISFILPGSLLAKNQIYYTLAIDADQNGLTSADLFAGRFQIGAVPFALSTQPSHSFMTHVGRVSDAGSFPQDRWQVMRVAPFEAPAGGVEFNKMNTYITQINPNVTFTFGIYDAQGKLVVSSGPIVNKDTLINAAYIEIKLPQVIRLEPTKIYYTGYATSNYGVDLAGGVRPANPVMGEVTLLTNNGSIPASFDPGKIAQKEYGNYALPIALTLDETPPAPARQGVDAPKPLIRWIFTEDPKVVKATPKSTGK